MRLLRVLRPASAAAAFVLVLALGACSRPPAGGAPPSGGGSPPAASPGGPGAPGARGPGESATGPGPAPPGTATPPAEPGTPPGSGTTGGGPSGGGDPSAPGAHPAEPVPPEPRGPVPFETLEKGYYSGLTDRSAVLVTDAESWAKLWQRHVSPQVPAPPAPDIDFDAYAVIAVSLGEKSSGGYTVEVVGVERIGDRLVLSVRTRSPARGAAVTAALSQPYHLVRIPRQEGPIRLDVKWE